MYEFVVQVLEPYTLLSLGLVASTVWAWRAPRPRSRALVASSVLVGLLVVLSTPFAGHLAMRSLEAPYPPGDPAPTPDDVIVVLSGGVSVLDDEGTEVRLGDETLKRCLYAVRLYRKAGGCRMILSGGKIDWSKRGPTFAAAMRDFLLELGVRPGAIVLEEKSSTTYENAVFTKALLSGARNARIFLVTEAAHMDRAQRCFRHQGVDVLPAPCDHHTGRWEFAATEFVPASRGISGIGRAAHEWLGIAWYRLRGRL